MAGKPFWYDIDLLLNSLTNAVIDPVAADPTGGDLKEGRFWYNTADKQLKFYDGSAIVVLATGGDVSDAVTRVSAAVAAGELMVSAGTDNTATSFDAKGTAGILKVNADNTVDKAVAGTDYLTEDSANSLTNKTFDANGTGNSISNIEVADLASTAKTTDMSVSALSTELATADVIKSYIDGAITEIETEITAIGTLVGGFSALAGTLPTTGSGDAGAITSGDFWRITEAGDITGLGHLEIGDALVAAANGAADAADYFVLQANLTDAVTSDGNGSVVNGIPVFDSTLGTTVTDSGATFDPATGIMNIPAAGEYQINGVNVLDGIDESYVQVDETGNINLPAGAEYRINGVNVLSTLTGAAYKYAAAFNDSTDWVGASAPFTFTVAAATHELGVSQDIIIGVKDSTGQTVEVGELVDASGNVTLTANAKFAGRVVLMA